MAAFRDECTYNVYALPCRLTHPSSQLLVTRSFVSEQRGTGYTPLAATWVQARPSVTVFLFYSNWLAGED